MAMKNRTKTIFVGDIGFDMYRRYSTNEWIVRVTKNNKRVESRCYYTSDREDAEETLFEMIREEELNHVKVSNS